MEGRIVTRGPKPVRPELASIAAEAARHLAWLAEAGVEEVPAPRMPRSPSPSSAPSPRPSRWGGRSPPHLPPQGGGEGVRAKPSPYSLSDKGCGSPELLAIRQDLGDCTRCKLHRGRTRLVFGVGNPQAELLFVGEGPGAEEDRQGEPFVGKAGQLLTRMIEAMGFARSQVYIANVVKCRPPENRDPEPDEIESCEPFLKAQIAVLRPRVIVALGRFAVQTLLRDGSPISRQRGRWREYQGVRCMPTFHPAYLLRNPAEKGKAWDDLKLVMKEFGKEPPRR
jgi:uracil-DNA glycosylase